MIARRFKLVIRVLAAAWMLCSVVIGLLAQRSQPQRPRNRDAQTQTETEPAPGKIIAHGDFDFDQQLALPKGIGNVDEATPDMDQPRSRHGRDPGGPDRGGVGETDKPRGKPPLTLPTATLFGKQTAVHNDPMIAVGEHFVVASDSRTIFFYARTTGTLLTPPTPKANTQCLKAATAGGMCMEQFFAPFLAPFLNDAKGNPDPSRPNPQDVNRQLPKPNLDPVPVIPPELFGKLRQLVCNPDNPSAVGCVNEAYDTRVIYDHERHRFWVETQLRNQLWNIGGKICEKKTCVPLATKLPQRFLAVAVSKQEDPTKGFHEFVLGSQYADWPTIGVHGPFLIVGHRGNKKVFLFDADKLQQGSFDSDFLHLGAFDDSDIDSDQILPVIQHDNRDGRPFIPTLPPSASGSTNVPTFLVGTSGNKITIYSFDTPKKLFDQPNFQPLRPSLMRFNLELKHDVANVIAVPVYRNGFIYLTWEECADTNGEWGHPCNRRVRVVRIPVFRDIFNRVIPSHDAALGFQNFAFGGDTPFGGGLTSYDIPALDVNRNDDVVIVYGRAAPVFFLATPGAFFSVSYHDTRGLVMDGELRAAQSCGAGRSNCVHEGQGDSHLDLSAVVIDPSDDTTAWMTHEFVDGATGDFKMVIGHVKP